MEITIERARGAAIASAHESIDGSNAAEFQRKLEEAIEGSNNAILDMSNVEFITSAGLRAILLTAQFIQRGDATFAVCAMTVAVREVFHISGFDQIITTYDSREDALGSTVG